MRRGEPRSVRSLQPQCWFLPLARVCPTVMPTRTPHHRANHFAGCVVRIDVHGSEDRAKDASPGRMRRSLVPASGAYALWRMPTTFPSSAPSGHPLSSARLRATEETATCWRTDQDPRSDDAPRRTPPSGRPGCLSPSRHAKELFREGIAPSGLRAGSLAHAAHTFSPGWGECLDRALQGHGAVTRGFRDRFESTDASGTRWNSRAWD